MFFTSKCVFSFKLQRLVNFQPCDWAPNSDSREPNLLKRKKSKFCHFSKNLTLSKNSARHRAPPKQIFLTSFITFANITFILQQHFRNLRASSVLISNIRHFKVCFFTKSRCSCCQCLTTIPELLFFRKNFLL